ncbi:Glucans biosynthesis protein C [Aquisphaera giovannonii]|uniref:Glucans biosynthesis protein C n=1 Tax=Aquisphaera giovannonii TaxID=406548 RepID=A0A5B9VX12_9BACT|nr:acyltransferase family protein [Aquisphaera giovannonii]QEH32873.1 Glucans biosynthesis protein C [Aquisphaera giovannonii]
MSTVPAPIELEPTKAQRRHDLDALRAFAMLLGIALHASMSFIPGLPWPVQDTQQAGWFMVLFLAIHGFRMPLFFLVSGFFTALLWQRRGPGGLIRNRTLRILVPCLLGLVTVVPAISVLPALATGRSLVVSAADDGSLIGAIRFGDAAAVRARLDEGAEIEAPDPAIQARPLSWAALRGDLDIARLLLERGADLKGLNEDLSTPLHAAAFTARPDLVRLFLEKGADPGVRGKDGSRPLEAARADWELVKGIADYIHIPVGDREEFERRRAEVIRILEPVSPGSAAVASTETPRATGPFMGVLDAYEAAMGSERLAYKLGGQRFHLVKSSVFAHLWFLWFLCWLAPLFVLFMAVATTIGLPRPSRRLVVSPANLLWLIPLTFVPQYFMGIKYPLLGPDTAEGLVLPPHLLLYYGIFFGFGALYYFTGDPEDRLGRNWRVSLPVALLVLIPAGIATMAGSRPLTALIQAAYVWLMCFGLLGLFRKIHPEENRAVRYLSDSSYWLYLTHLAVVMTAQVLVQGWSLPATLKFGIVFAGTVAPLLLAYQLLVRHTWIGWLLNGTRHRPAPAPEAEAPAATASA